MVVALSGRRWTTRETENSKFCECHDGRAETNAERLLAKRIGEVQTGTLPSPRANRTLMSDLGEALFKAQRAALLRKIPENLPTPTREWRLAQAEGSVEHNKARWKKHLAPVFGDRKAALVTAADLADYQAARIDAKARHATVNRELQLLRRAFRLGYKVRPRLVQDVPEFPPRMVEGPRQGFIEDETFEKLHAAITEPGVKALVLVAYRLGFRKSELQNILVMQYADGWLRLFAGATKNSEARAVALPSDVNDVVAKCAAGKLPDAYLFTWSDHASRTSERRGRRRRQRLECLT